MLGGGGCGSGGGGGGLGSGFRVFSAGDNFGFSQWGAALKSQIYNDTHDWMGGKGIPGFACDGDFYTNGLQIIKVARPAPALWP
jgi:hypothetical protein